MHFGRFEAISLTNVAACSLALNDAGGARNAAHDALDLAQGAYPGRRSLRSNISRRLQPWARHRGAALFFAVTSRLVSRQGCERDVAEARGYETLWRPCANDFRVADYVTSSTKGALLTDEEATLEALEI